MRSIAKLLIMLLLVSITMSGVTWSSPALMSDRRGFVSASGSKPFTPGAVLDAFSAGATINAWGILTSTFSSSAAATPPPDAICAASYTNNPAITYGGSGYSLKLTYNVTSANSFAGYASPLESVDLKNLGTPPASYNAISFYVKGSAGGEFFKIQLNNKSATSYIAGATTYKRNTSSVYITDYLDGGVTTGWRKVTIPFNNFANLDGFSSMKEFVIVFENAQSVVNGINLPQGVVYIDNITFENIPVTTPTRVDYFSDKLGVCALGGNIGTGVGAGAAPDLNRYSFSNAAGEFNTYANGFRLEYNVTVGYAYTYFIFGGGNDAAPATESGWIAIPQDFSAYNTLAFKIKAKSVNENPRTLKIELVDKNGAKAYIVTGITADWKTYAIPLSSFPLLDKATLKQLTLVFEDWRINAAEGNKAGVAFIDSIQFEQ